MDRRKRLGPVAVPLLFMLSAFPVFAGGYEWGGFGGRSGAMGGAFIGLADDWTANYWNPAGLGQLTGRAIGVDVIAPNPRMYASNSYANLPPTPETVEMYKYTHDMFINYSGIEPLQFSKTRTSDHFFHPNGIGGYAAHPELTYGAAIYSPLGYYSDWNDTIPYGAGTIHAKNFEQLLIIEPQFSLAREIFTGFYAGGGIGLLYDRLERESEKTVSNSMILDYNYDFDMTVDGFGAEGLFGLLYKITDQLSVGAVYRTGASVALSGKANSGLSLMGDYEDTHAEQQFRHPATAGIGFAVKPIPDVLTLTADWQWTQWSVWRTNVRFNQDGILLSSEDYSEDWSDSDRYRFGCELWVVPTWALRGGFMWDESPMPDKSVSLAYIPDVNRKAVSLGTGVKLGEDWQVDLLGAYAWGKRDTETATFEQKIWAVSLAASYAF